jgi:hypothetical protein
MKAIISALVLLGFVGVTGYAQDAAPTNDAPGAINGGADRDPAKAHHKKSAKKKKHAKKHKTNAN